MVTELESAAFTGMANELAEFDMVTEPLMLSPYAYIGCAGLLGQI